MLKENVMIMWGRTWSHSLGIGCVQVQHESEIQEADRLVLEAQAEDESNKVRRGGGVVKGRSWPG
jgi:hypothetical protein